jgi:hypothetical protein
MLIILACNDLQQYTLLNPVLGTAYPPKICFITFMLITLGKTPWSSGKGEDSCPRGSEFEYRLRCRGHLSCTINLDQTHES